MKKLLTILFFATVKCYGQDSLVWQTNNEIGVVSYTVQKSIDANNWVDMAKVMPAKKDSNTYAYPLTQTNYYYRIQANMISGVYETAPDLLAAPLPVEISNVSVTGRILRFTSNNENNLKSYIIFESIDGVNFVEVNRISPKGNGDYQINLK